MRVVVGKAAPTQTPVFTQDMTYVVFRPYWNVPPSIRRGEIVPAITRDRNYIAKKGFEVTTNGRQGRHRRPDLRRRPRAAEGRQARRPAEARPDQRPGTRQADLPERVQRVPAQHAVAALFAKSRRDFSHGCIRVEKPAELAAWALRNNPDWTLERVKEAMQTGPNDVTVKLDRPVPVFIVYATALAYENGEVHFYDDIYGHDADLAQALAKGYPYPSS